MQPRQVHVGQLHRRHLSGADELPEVTNGPERDVLEVGRARDRRRRAQPKHRRRRADGEARHDRTEMKWRRHVRWNVEVADLLEAGQIAIRPFDKGGALLFAQVYPRHGERIGDHGQRDALCARILHPRPEDAWRQGRAKPRPGKMGHESPSRLVDVLHLVSVGAGGSEDPPLRQHHNSPNGRAREAMEPVLLVEGCARRRPC